MYTPSRSFRKQRDIRQDKKKLLLEKDDTRHRRTNKTMHDMPTSQRHDTFGKPSESHKHKTHLPKNLQGFGIRVISYRQWELHNFSHWFFNMHAFSKFVISMALPFSVPQYVNDSSTFFLAGVSGLFVIVLVSRSTL